MQEAAERRTDTAATFRVGDVELWWFEEFEKYYAGVVHGLKKVLGESAPVTPPSRGATSPGKCSESAWLLWSAVVAVMYFDARGARKVGR